MVEGDSLEDEWRNEGEAALPSRTPVSPATANEGRAAAERSEGIILRVGEKFGFIKSFSFSENVYVDRKQLPKMEKNMKVTFRPQVTKKGVNALDVRVEGVVDLEDSAQMEPLNHEGIVKKIDPDRKYGFIVSTGDQPAGHSGDIFIHKKLLGDLKLGDRVRFSCKVKNGKAEAVRLETLIVEDDGVAEDTPDMVGYIKSFEESQGYGFIRSPQATQNYNMGSRDVFLHRKQLKNFKAGDTVRFKVKLNRDGHPQAFRLRETDEVVVEQTPVAEEPKSSKTETWIGEIKSFNPINGFGFIRNTMLQEKYGRDVFLPESQFEGLKIGDSVSFVLQVKDGKPQAFEVKRLSKKSNLTSPALAPSPDEHLELPDVKEVTEVQTEIEAQDPQELSKSSRRLIRACQSERPGSIEDVQAALEDGAEVNSRDVTGQTPLMISSLNTRGADRKCKLLLEHRADLQLPSDPMSTQSTLEWVKERINQRFADYLEALSKGEAAKLELTLDAPVADEF